MDNNFKPHPCPGCKEQVIEKLKGIWPFCSSRCKLIDLGAWSAEEYRIPAKEDSLSTSELSSENTEES